MRTLKLSITGYVQGIGFRPFIYNIAIKNDLTGWVCNTSGIVTIVIQGNTKNLDSFVNDLYNNPLPHCIISSIQKEELISKSMYNFKIIESQLDSNNKPKFISPDISICDHCISEINDISNIRYKYPFTNCTHCGPRFSIISEIPYDRIRTTMSDFKLCSNCNKEYLNNTDYRFHAQTNCCPDCGPSLSIYNSPLTDTKEILNFFNKSIEKGDIWSIKGLGGFHITCDAFNSDSISKLRLTKNRPTKPFAIMFKNIAEAKKHCFLTDIESKILQSPAAPILLLKKRNNSPLPNNISPNTKDLGVMLPYTPLHHLLFTSNISCLLMTSGNISSLPMEYTNLGAIDNLSNYVDYILLHNRTIENPVDDSVCKVIHNNQRNIRLSRGYTPLTTTWTVHNNLLAFGSNEKNTFSISINNSIVTGPHIGDLDNYETLKHFERYLLKFISLYKFQAKKIILDIHPNFAYTNLSKKFNKELFYCQHHHSHIASCLVDNNYTSTNKVLGIAFDGTGLGSDNCIWGSEFMLVSLKDYKSITHLSYTPLPTNEDFLRNPNKIALCYLYNLSQKHNIENFIKANFQPLDLLFYQNISNINLINSSSMGRLFDCISALLKICSTSTYDGEAAILLENILTSNNITIGYNYTDGESELTINPSMIIYEVIQDIYQGVPCSEISLKFHSTIVNIIVNISQIICKKYNLSTIALSGGVFSNSFILSNSITVLEALGYTVLTHKKIPNNDAGISIGQIAIASANL